MSVRGALGFGAIADESLQRAYELACLVMRGGTIIERGLTDQILQDPPQKGESI
ncbi:MAG: hypothetical protein ACYCYO_18070 [Bacilli bacterium]